MNLKIIYTKKCKQRDGWQGPGVSSFKATATICASGDNLDGGNGNEKVIV